VDQPATTPDGASGILLVSQLSVLPGEARAQRAIEGLVTDAASGRALSSATVTAVGTPGSVHTAGNGHYRINNLAAGVVRLRVASVGYLPDSAEATVTGFRCRPPQLPVEIRTSPPR
jgi:hypothetical protein